MRGRCLRLAMTALLALPPSLGCAAMMYGSTEEVSFQSVPSGARLEVDGNPVGSTPARLELKRRKSHTAVMRKPGYHDQVVEIDSNWSGKAIGWSFVGALAWWGPFEWLLDLPTGSLKKLSQTKVRAHLEKTEELKRQEALAAQRRRWELELTRFRGLFHTWEGGVDDAEESSAVSAGVPAADGGAGPVGPDPGGAVPGVRALGPGDLELGPAGGA